MNDDKQKEQQQNAALQDTVVKIAENSIESGAIYAATIAKLEAENAALRAGQEWQMMDTAPRDGSRILASCLDEQNHYRVGVVYWREDETDRHRDQWMGGGHFNSHGLPTHWMPLPAAPAQATAGED